MGAWKWQSYEISIFPQQALDLESKLFHVEFQFLRNIYIQQLTKTDENFYCKGESIFQTRKNCL